MPTFTQHSGADASPLVSALTAGGTGIAILPGSVQLSASAPTAAGYYDGTASGLEIGAGIILTSGRMPGTANGSTSFGVSNGGAGSALIDAVINPVFHTKSYDATTLTFQFTVTDPAATSVSLDLVFGTEEYPEWVDAFVDCAVVYVNGTNYAMFNHDPNAPLSVISQNLAAGYFNNNAKTFGIEYDGISNTLTIVAPIVQGGVNTITLGISDTGDHILDSGVILSGLTAGTLPGSGVVVTQPGSETDGADNCVGTSQAEVFDLKGGDDTAYGAGGDDLMSGGAGMDSLNGGSGDDALSGGADDDVLEGGTGDDTASYAGDSADYELSWDAAADVYTVTALAAGAVEGSDTLIGIEKLSFADGLFALAAGSMTAVPPPGGTGGTGGTGGVLPPPPVNTPGALTLEGIASQGQDLTASVSDVDGIPGTVHFVWQRSVDNGASWGIVAPSGDTYTVTGDDAGALVRVLATYTDGLGKTEGLTSFAKAVPGTPAGDLKVTLLQLDAPKGASIASPLTTLVARAIDLGMTANTAEAMVKQVLALPGGVNVLHYDAYAAVTANPSDTTALTYLTRMVQVAILTSLTDDDTGLNLALKMLEAQQAGQGLDLSDVDDLGTILGIDPVPGSDGKYPQPLDEIEDRCKSLADSLADGADLDSIQKEWSDFASVQEEVFVGQVGDLAQHLNQAPEGTAQGTLAGQAGDTVLLTAADLLPGFSDPEGGALSVSGLTADQGTLTKVAGGWSFTPSAAGPVEFSYTVKDAQGLSVAGAKVMIVAPAPVADLPPVALDDAVATAQNTAATFDPRANDNAGEASDTLSPPTVVAGPAHGVAQVNGDGSLTYTPAAYWFGTDTLSYAVQDAAGASAEAVVTISVAGPDGQTLGPVVEDAAGTAPWDIRFDAFDAGGDRVARTMIYDDGHVVHRVYANGLIASVTSLDPLDAATWSTRQTDYDAQGHIAASGTVFDDGHVVDTTYVDGIRSQAHRTDPAAALAWAWRTCCYDAAGQLVLDERMLDDGRSFSTAFVGGLKSVAHVVDTADAFVWSEQTDTWDAAGELASRTLVYDDGRVMETTYAGGVRDAAVLTDVADVYDWSTKVYAYDDTGHLTGVTVIDDGAALL